MRDISAAEYEQLRRVSDLLQAYLGGRGFETIDTPLLEETELFVRKSGGGLTSRLYTFVDPGGHRVSLRPEFTSSVIRAFIGLPSPDLPVRWQYAGPVFRNEGRNGSVRQFYQLGAEIIGARGTLAEADAMALALGALDQLGLGASKIRIGHLGLLTILLSEQGLSDSAVTFVVSNVQQMRSGETDTEALMARAAEIGLVSAPSAPKPESVSDRDIAEGPAYVRAVLSEAMSAPLGRRSADQVFERLVRKMKEADDPDALAGGLRLAAKLAELAGEPAAAIQSAASITSDIGLEASVLDELRALTAALSEVGVAPERTVLDLGLVRDVSYYTGITFDIVSESGGDAQVVLGGGGRYDGLVEALGGDDVPALGFALDLDRVAAASTIAAKAASR